MNNYEKDTIFNNNNEHGVHIDPSISDLKKIINIEGPQRILIYLYKTVLFTCAKAYENTHQDMYKTLCDNNYISNDNNNFGFLIETKQFFGGSIIYNKNQTIENKGLSLYCKNFNLHVISGAYNSIKQAQEFYNLLPQSLKNIVGELDLNECSKHISHENKPSDNTLESYLIKYPEKDILLKQIFTYMSDVEKLLDQEDVNVDKVKRLVKMIIMLYQSYRHGKY